MDFCPIVEMHLCNLLEILQANEILIANKDMWLSCSEAVRLIYCFFWVGKTNFTPRLLISTLTSAANRFADRRF